MPLQVDELITPALLIDRTKLLRNISMMATKARKGGVRLRPHVKTHKCLEIARLQEGAGATGITVSTLAEAAAFVDGEFSDITLAYPIISDKIPAFLALTSRASVKALVDHPAMVTALEASCSARGVKLDVLLKVDCGYHRCGVDPKQREAVSLAKAIDSAPHLRFGGILTHAGHAYNATSGEEIAGIARGEQTIMVEFARKLQDSGLAVETVSIGSTPTVMASKRFEKGITEIRPGNYVFFDACQVALGSCELAACALSVLTSVVSVHSDHIVVDAGATALSKDAGVINMVPEMGYGAVLASYDSDRAEPNMRITALSQEHGKIQFTGKTSHPSFAPGDCLRVVPNHSCLTADLFDRYYVVEKDTVVACWPVRRERLAKEFEPIRS
jgi:D-serine deaminase-like pyridoxal phosphate-dependent protein